MSLAKDMSSRRAIEKSPAAAFWARKAAPIIGRLWAPAVSFGWFIAAWALILGLWEIAAGAGWLNARILPPPSETFTYFLSGDMNVGFGLQRTGLGEAVAVTLGRVTAGMLLGLAGALALAVAAVELRLARNLIMPIAQTLAPIAPVAWIPFAIAVVGIGGPAATFIVFITVIGSMTLALVAALDNIPAEYLKIAHNLATPKFRLWMRVRLPAIAPHAVTTLRMSFFGAWMAVLAGEMAGINSGLGYAIIMAQQTFNMRMVMIGIIVIGLIGFLADRVLVMLGRRIVWWEQLS